MFPRHIEMLLKNVDIRGAVAGDQRIEPLVAHGGNTGVPIGVRALRCRTERCDLRTVLRDACRRKDDFDDGSTSGIVPSDSKRSFKSTGTLTDETGTVIATAEAVFARLDAAFSSTFFQTMSFEGAGITAGHFEERRAAAAGAAAK